MFCLCFHYSRSSSQQTIDIHGCPHKGESEVMHRPFNYTFQSRLFSINHMKANCKGIFYMM